MLPARPDLLPPFDPSRVRFEPALFSVRGRRGAKIDTIVIHTSEGSFRGTIAWFKNPASKVSSHFVVARDGTVVQMVREEDSAIHTGSWAFDDRSIGIEHEGFAHKNTWTAEQMAASAALTRHLIRKFRIPPDRAHIVGHCEMMPTDRTDPGPDFDWDGYIRILGGRPDPDVRFEIAHDYAIPADVRPLIDGRRKREALFTKAGEACGRRDFAAAVELLEKLAADDADPELRDVARRNLAEREELARARERREAPK